MFSAEAVADALLREHDHRQAFHALRDDVPLGSIDEAYAAQAELVKRLQDRHRCGPVGYKIGLTSPRMQTLCGIPHPVAGVLLANRLHASGASIPVSPFVHPGLECEVAVRIGADLAAGRLPTTIEEMAACVAAVAPAFELVDDRHADYAVLDAPTLVADNAWNAGTVLGAFREAWPDLAAIEGVAERNGGFLDRGFGRDVLGHPFAPLLWLSRHLVDRGNMLRAGDIVLTGSLVPTCFPSPGERFRFSLAGLGSVEVSLTG